MTASPAPPTVSVHMAVYNQRRYVGEAVESILRQDFPDFELVVVDDGSTDGSHAILERLAASDDRVRLLRRPNRGISASRNEALEVARGEFVAVMDSDDVALPHRLGRQVAFLRETPGVVAAGSWVLWTDPAGNPLREYRPATGHDEIDRLHLEQGAQSICHPSTMVRAAAMRRAGGYRETFPVAEDLDLWLRLAEIGRLANIPEVLLHYRKHPASAAHTRQALCREMDTRAVRDACARRGLAGPAADRQTAADPSTLSEADHRAVWVWWALASGRVASARKNAVRLVRLEPLSKRSWETLACSIRGR